MTLIIVWIANREWLNPDFDSMRRGMNKSYARTRRIYWW